ncbi:MAG: hypothetical protein DME74_11305 [Verrucomicrobia bacterium]|nr:MAG: hypothetical protein DME74_11305 [Verrucomicrobiota bacterium]
MRGQAQAPGDSRNQRVDLMSRQTQAQFRAKCDRFVHSKFRVNDVVLRDVTDSNFPQPRSVRQRHATEAHLARSRRVNTAKRVEQRCLSMSRSAQHPNKFSSGDIERDLIQNPAAIGQDSHVLGENCS